VAVTRPRAQADGLSRRLADLGARVVQAPLIRTEPVPGDPIDPSACDILVVTSPNAPALLLERIGGDARALHGVEVAAIGPATAAALREVGIVADLVSERAVAEALLDLLADRAAGRRVLIARAEEARDLLPDGLAARGAEVEIAVLYRTVPVVPDTDAALGADAVAFTSASTARAFAAAFAGHDLDGVRGVAIGPATSAAMRELGIPVAAEAAEHDLDGLVAALVELLG